jgi:hypothetical protein
LKSKQEEEEEKKSAAAEKLRTYRPHVCALVCVDPINTNMKKFES